MNDWYTITGFADEIDEMCDVQFKHLNEIGVSYFESRGIDGKNISDLTEDEAAALKEKMDSYGIRVSSIGSPIGKIKITDDFDAHMEKLAHTIRIMQILEAQYIRIFSFYVPEGECETYRDEVMRRMKTMTALAEKENIVLLHENEKGIYGDIAVRCRDILDTVNSPNLKAVFDPANFVQCGQITYPDGWELLKKDVVYMHIKDCLADGEVVPSGFGIGHVEEILSDLKKSGWTGFLSVEPHLGSFTGLSGLSEDDGRRLESKERSSAEKYDLATNALKDILARI